MSRNENKKVEVQFCFDALVCKQIQLDGSCNPIATRTRSRSNCKPASKSKTRTLTPTPKKPTRNISTPIPNPISSLDQTPSPKRTRSSIRRSSSKKVVGFSPRVRKSIKFGYSSEEREVAHLQISNGPLSVDSSPPEDASPDITSIPSPDRTPSKRTRSSVKLSSSKKIGSSSCVRKVIKMGCSSKEGKVTPLKIINGPPSDDCSPPEDNIQDIASPCERKTPQKEKECSPLVSIVRLPTTPKTPRFTNGDSTVTPRTRSTNRKRTGRSPSATPTSRFSVSKEVPQTPYSTRSKLKKEIQALKTIEEDCLEDDSEFSDSEHSEFEVEDSQSESDSEVTESDPDYECTPAKRNRISTLQKTETSSPSSVYRITPHKKIVHQNVVVLDSEKYFEKKSQKTNISDNVLSKLPLPELSQCDISEITSKNYVKHQKEINCLMEKYREQFNKWLLYLRDGFNLMLYGLGSKLEILKEFQNEKLSNSYVLRVNGFNPNFSINEMVKAFMKEILHLFHCPVNINDAIDIAAKELEQKECHVFIIINNIDGVALRGSKKQTILSKLAESPYVHIIASVDHINAPLLWGNNKMSCFNFVWLDVTTFRPYVTEISYQKTIDIENLGSDSSLELLDKVFNWQDRRTKEVFELIVKDFMNNKNKKNFKGTLTSELLRSAARNLSISSKSALISTLKAFIEHDIIHIEHNYLKFSINPNTLSLFYNKHFSR